MHYFPPCPCRKVTGHTFVQPCAFLTLENTSFCFEPCDMRTVVTWSVSSTAFIPGWRFLLWLLILLPIEWLSCCYDHCNSYSATKRQKLRLFPSWEFLLTWCHYQLCGQWSEFFRFSKTLEVHMFHCKKVLTIINNMRKWIVSFDHYFSKRWQNPTCNVLACLFPGWCLKSTKAAHLSMIGSATQRYLNTRLLSFK